MSDMSHTIIAKSDQLNADDLLGGPRTIRIREVTVREGGEQPVSIYFDGDDGKPWKPCKSMCRVLVAAWGVTPGAYVGKSMTLYRDPDVTWAGMKVGGIRISHMSDIRGDKSLALTVKRGQKAQFNVQPLKGGASPLPPPSKSPPPPPPPPPADDRIDMGGDDEETGYPFTLQDKNGNEHVMRGDGGKWSRTLIGAMSKAFDQAKRTWEANEEYVKAAEDAGETEFTAPVRAKWEERKAAAGA